MSLPRAQRKGAIRLAKAIHAAYQEICAEDGIEVTDWDNLSIKYQNYYLKIGRWIFEYHHKPHRHDRLV